MGNIAALRDASIAGNYIVHTVYIAVKYILLFQLSYSSMGMGQFGGLNIYMYMYMYMYVYIYSVHY